MVKHFPCHLTRHLSRIVIVSHMHSCRSYESDIYAINVLYFRYYRKGWKTSIVNACEWMHCHHLGKTCFLIPPHFHNEGRHCNCQSNTCARKKNEREYGYSVVILLGTQVPTLSSELHFLRCCLAPCPVPHVVLVVVLQSLPIN